MKVRTSFFGILRYAQDDAIRSSDLFLGILRYAQDDAAPHLLPLLGEVPEGERGSKNNGAKEPLSHA